MGGENAFSSNHASEVVGSGFPTNQNGLATFLSSLYGVVGGEYGFTDSSTRRSVEALGKLHRSQPWHRTEDAATDQAARGLRAVQLLPW